MKNRWQVLLITIGMAVLFASRPMLADGIDLTLLPGSDISGAPGSTVGWGYTITNDTSDWIATMSISATGFTNGTPNAIFDLPAVAPDSSVTELFTLGATASCAVPPCGLYSFTWDATASVGTVNSGVFTVGSDFYSGDPSDPSSTDLGVAPDASAAYSVTATAPVATPEPTSLILLLTGLGLGGALRVSRRKSFYMACRKAHE